MSADKELELKVKVAMDLLKEGAEEIVIIGPNLKVVRRPQMRGASPVQVNVNAASLAQSSARASVTISVKLKLALEELRDRFKADPEKIEQIEQKTAVLEKELSKESPNKSTLKKILKWAMDFSWEVFCKLAPVIIEKLTSG
ncbi:hypothetical protein ACFL1I_00990 [Candidatus Omnitrophota bacterium]